MLDEEDDVDEIEDYLNFLGNEIYGDGDEDDSEDVPLSEEETAIVKNFVKAIKDALFEFLGLIAASDGGRDFYKTVCDARVKRFLEEDVADLANSDKPLSSSDIAKIMYLAGDGDGTFNLDDSENWDDGMIGKYADHLKNYLYTYKNEATQVDPSIDPNEEHVGPMAQDIEKVAPDCVKETQEGVKVVDGDRLALVNAGVIGDLSREVLELRGRLAALEAKQ